MEAGLSYRYPCLGECEAQKYLDPIMIYPVMTIASEDTQELEYMSYSVGIILDQDPSATHYFRNNRKNHVPICTYHAPSHSALHV